MGAAREVSERPVCPVSKYPKGICSSFDGPTPEVVSSSFQTIDWKVRGVAQLWVSEIRSPPVTTGRA